MKSTPSCLVDTTQHKAVKLMFESELLVLCKSLNILFCNQSPDAVQQFYFPLKYNSKLKVKQQF